MDAICMRCGTVSDFTECCTSPLPIEVEEVLKTVAFFTGIEVPYDELHAGTPNLRLVVTMMSTLLYNQLSAGNIPLKAIRGHSSEELDALIALMRKHDA